MNEKMSRMSNGAKFGLAGGLATAIAASACCLGPLVLMVLGVSGAWIGTLTALAPYQPIFTVLALALLGLAFYKTYRKPKTDECAPGGYCATSGINKVMLWIFTAAIIGLLVFPFAVPLVFADSSGVTTRTQQVTLKVENMSCYTCAIPVRKSLERVDGVVSAKVTMKPPRAVVVYDPAKTTADDLTKATTNAGYPSKVTGEGSAK